MAFYEKTQKPLIGFEPMTYALPWRYSTTELKGPFISQFLTESLCIYIENLSMYIYYIHKLFYTLEYISRLIAASGSLRNRVGKWGLFNLTSFFFIFE